MKKRLLMVLAAILAITTGFALTACEKASTDNEPPARTRDSEDSETAEKVGEIKIKLFPGIAPIAVENFINLANSGYYEGKLMHRIIPNFMIQGGSPFGDGMSDPDYKDYFRIEPHDNAVHSYGALSMANAGPDYNSQQFFIVNVEDKARCLDGGYTVFGHTVEGFDMIDAVSAVKTDADDKKPLSDVIIDSVTIHTVDGESESDPEEGNINGDVKLESGDTYAVITLRITG